jgi:hypothetical protein
MLKKRGVSLLMNKFDSKRYLPYDELQMFLEKSNEWMQRSKHYEKEFKEMFIGDEVRYSFAFKENWLEETFENIEDEILTVYHDIPDRQAVEHYLEEIFQLFGFIWGGKISETKTKDEALWLIIDSLTIHKDFHFSQGVIVYMEEDKETLLEISLFFDNHYLIKSGKERDIELARTVKDLLKDI